MKRDHHRAPKITSLGVLGRTLTTYLYDMENRLVLVGNDMELLYDPLGRLYQIGRKNGTKTYFLYDGDNLVAEYQNGVMTKRYVHGDGMQAPLISYDGGSISEGSIQFLHTNHQGSVIALSDAEGAVTDVNTYDPYGGVGSQTGRFGYTGQMFLPELDLYYYRARIYNPALGRFLQTDPVGYEDQMNLYAYVGNDPVNKIDPTGMYYEEVVVKGHRIENPCGCPSLRGEQARQFLNSLTDTAAMIALNGGVFGHVANSLLNSKSGEKREKTKEANKKDKKQVDDAAKQKGVKDRRGFGDFIEKEKKMQGRGGSDNFTYEELLDLADEFNESGGY